MGGGIPRCARQRLASLTFTLITALCLYAGVARADAKTWLFTGNNSSWTGSGGVTLSNDGSNLVATFANPGGAIMSDVLNPPYAPATGVNHDYIRLGYKVTAGNIAQLRFNFRTTARANFTSPNLDLPITADNNLHYLTFHVDHTGDWRNSTITQIRLLMLNAAGGGATGTLKLDFVVIRLDDLDPTAPDVPTVTPDPTVYMNGDYTVDVSGDDPPPDGFSGTANPDMYASGVSAFGWRIGTGPETWVGINGYNTITGTATASFTVPAAAMGTGTNALIIRSQDRCGRIGPTRTQPLKFDGVAPTTPVITSIVPYGVTSAPDGYAVQWSVPIEDHSGIARYEYFFYAENGTPDGPNEVGQNSVSGITPPTNGHYTFRVRAVDNAGNEGPLSDATNMWWDNEPPSTPTITQVTPTGWTKTNGFAFNWTDATDNYLGIGRYAYLIDGSIGPVNLGASPGVSGVNAPNPGTHTFQVRAEDVISNAGDWSDPIEFKFDNVPPTLAGPPVVSPGSWTNTNAFSVTWPAANDTHSGIAGYEYSINGGAGVPTPGTNISGAFAATVGVNTIQVSAIDLAGNRSPWSVADTIYYNPAYIPAPVAQSPSNGANVALPETFSWLPVANATGYEIQVARGGNFSGDVWTTQTTQTSMVVPQIAAPLSGSHAWRIRSLGSVPESEWAPSQSFLRVTTVSLPGAVALLQPAQGASVPSGDALFQWGAVAGASTYRLEFSRDTQFTPGVGTWGVSDLTATNSLVNLPEGAETVYWRVTARNAQGYGPPSSTRSIDIVPPAPSLTAVALLVPSQDLAVEEGMALLTDGLVVGRPMGTVTVEWIWDDEVLATETVQCNGAGFKPTPIALPTAELGPHTLKLRVTGPNVLESATRTVEVQAPGFGPAVKLVLVPDQSHILPESTTVFYCTVRDSDDAIVLNDTGRSLGFALTSGEGSLTASNALTEAGVATTSYIAPASESSPVIEVTDVAPLPGMRATPAAPLRGGMSPAFVCTSRFDIERNLALAYLHRLETLGNTGLRWAADDSNWPKIDVEYARNFVQGTHAGDEARLHRLNIFLRYVDRAYFYNPDFDKIGPREKGVIPGSATMILDYSYTSGLAALQVVDAATDIAETLKGVRGVNAVVEKAKKDVVKSISKKLIQKAQDLAERQIDKRVKDPALRIELKNDLEGLFLWASSRVDHSSMTSNGLVVGNYALTKDLSDWLVNRKFVKPMQDQLNRVVWEIRKPEWSGGSDANAENVAQVALNDIGRETRTRHADVVNTVKQYDHIFVEIATDVGKGLATLSQVIVGPQLGKFLQILATVVFDLPKTAIFYATGHDALSRATWIKNQAVFVASTCIANGGSVAPLTEQARPMVRYEAFPMPPVRGGSAPISAELANAVASGVNDALDDYENAARAVERSIADGDPYAVGDLIGALADADDRLEDGLRSVTSPLRAVGDTAELSVADFEAQRDSVEAALLVASMNRLMSQARTLDWLTDPDNDSLMANAVSSIQVGIDSTRLTAREAVALSSSTIGENAPAFLSLTSPEVPEWDAQGDTTVIRVTVRNLGGAVATGARVRLSAQPEFEFQSSEVQELGDLAPGATGTASWVLRLIPTMTAEDSTRDISFTVCPDSGFAGTSNAGSLEVLFSPNVLGVDPDAVQRLLRPMAIPNPFQSAVAIRFTLPARGTVLLEIFDLAGRRIRQIEHQGLSAGLHDLAWDGRTSTGELASPGVYLAKLTMPSQRTTMRVVRVR